MKTIRALSVLYAYLPLCLLLQGCVGGAVLTSRTKTFRDPVIWGKDSLFGRDELRDLPQRDPQADMYSITNVLICTSGWLEYHWGKPVSITHSGAGGLDEIWTYKFDPIWEGIEPYILVPIPIELPVRRETIRFVLRDDRVISATRIEPYRVGGVAGFIISPDRPYFGAFSLTDE
jgi:hypothetical protein